MAIYYSLIFHCTSPLPSVNALFYFLLYLSSITPLYPSLGPYFSVCLSRYLLSFPPLLPSIFPLFHLYISLSYPPFFPVSNVILIGVFWLVGGLFLYTDVTGRPKWMHYYKVQPDANSPIDLNKLKKALKTILFNNVFLNLLFAYPLYSAQMSAGIKFGLDELPTVPRFLYEFVMIALVQEVIFYYSHR